ncbi:MAG TPA: 16S rRNA (cytosine(967)-C(5))-methyltransferase RsmB [Nitrosospira sp.]|nr:16S rRNA (cytosine(967)-C(5))-methyltransferase RsmB [Nitrosospira sp.]
MIKAQSTAAESIAKVLKGESLTAVLQDVWRDQPGMSGQQRGAIQDLSYGVLRHYGQLDALLKLLLNKPVWNKDLHCLLLVALYQLIYSKSASYAIVDSAVSASNDFNGNKAVRSLTNAVLRNFLRNRPTLLAEVAGSEIGRFSHPQWWIDKLRAQYPDQYQAILGAGNFRAPMTLRINRRRISSSEYQSLLREVGIEVRLSRDDAVELAQPISVDKLPGFAEGLVSVQDMAAQMAGRLLDVHEGMRVLDACAAPGGKTAHLLELADVELTAIDDDAIRAALVTQNLARLGLSAHCVMQGNASQSQKWWNDRQFDRILADVPCSASGVTRRHPDIKWLRREDDIPRFASRQREILESLWQMLIKGGKLLYATCSIFAEENRLQVDQFLHRHSDAHLLPLPEGETLEGQLLPNAHHDGFYYALLGKT